MRESRTVYIAVTNEWLERLSRALIPMPDGGFCKVGWIEPLIDSEARRILLVPADATGTIDVNMYGSNFFSKN